MEKVVIQKTGYDYSDLRKSIFTIMDFLGGETIEKNSRVLIKPNLLAPAPPGKGMLTHPRVVKAVAEYLIQKGVKPIVSDSPAMGSFHKVLRESGFDETLKGLDIICKEFTTSVKVDMGRPFGMIEIARDALNADLIINLPKLKTHSQMLLTLGVKNFFGCIVGKRKPEWHLRTGVDREMFARLLVALYQSLHPSITILDGILAMEGQGPGKSGTPRHMGILMGSNNAVDIDVAVCRIIGIEPERLLTNKVAKDKGLVNNGIEITGELPVIKNFVLPEITPLIFGPPKLHGFMRRHLVQRPICDYDLCALCGECWKYCPAEAITRDRKNVNFDYDRCIRCYCCIEVCPHGALFSKEPLLGKIIGTFFKK
jgi:uncharacterized protein (DUF362 family)/Pyruvate/2-oxoacid:ferredoxin oxidoreductase delta subunit